jgi:hypothetical protein
MVDGGEAMEVVAAGLGDDVDDAARRMPELGLVARSNDLKLGDRVLIELRRRPSGQFVFIGKTIDEEARVISTLAQDRSSVVTVEVSLAINSDAGNELKEVEIVAAVDGHIADVLRENRRARGGRIRLKQRQFGGDVHDFLDATDFELEVERKSAIDGDVQISERVCGESGVRHGERVHARRKILKLIGTGRVRDRRAARANRVTGEPELRSADSQALLVGDRALDRRSGLRVRRGQEKHTGGRRQEQCAAGHATYRQFPKYNSANGFTNHGKPPFDYAQQVAKSVSSERMRGSRVKHLLHFCCCEPKNRNVDCQAFFSWRRTLAELLASFTEPLRISRGPDHRAHRLFVRSPKTGTLPPARSGT